jgi:flagellar assembly protein FliH
VEVYSFPALDPAAAAAPVSGSPVERAARLVQRAQAEAAAITADAAQRGHAEGYAAGLEQARAELEPAQAALESAVMTLHEARDAFVAAVEPRAAELALALAEKIVGAALELKPELVLEVVAGALRRAVERDQLVVEVNPDDLELVRAQAEDLAGRLGGIHRLEIVAERRVGRGGCVVRTTEGEIDARIGEQLEKAAEVVREALDGR